MALINVVARMFGYLRYGCSDPDGVNDKEKKEEMEDARNDDARRLSENCPNVAGNGC